MEDYNIWNKEKEYGDVLYERATGKKEEMECSKALCKILSPFYRRRMKVLDVGCGPGHYLRSLRRLDENIDYTGMDITEYYIKQAKKAFANVPFYLGDIYNIPFDDNSFDIVLCSNVLLHLPPFPKKAISELLRVSSKYTVIRIPFGENNYIIKECKSIDGEGNPVDWYYLNLYTEQYFKKMMDDIGSCHYKIIDDTFWNELKDPVNAPNTTRIINGRQVSGSILLDWKFLVFEEE